jgi:hypothetical protein
MIRDQLLMKLAHTGGNHKMRFEGKHNSTSEGTNFVVKSSVIKKLFVRSVLFKGTQKCECSKEE